MSNPADFDPVAFLEQFVRIESYSGEEQAVARFLVATLHQLGFAADIDGAGNVVATACARAADDPTAPIILLGHIDTVAGIVPVRREQGRLYGRGTVDAKGAFATFVAAAAKRRASGNFRAPLILVGAVEEEAASSKGAHFILDRYAPAACIIGEPSGWERLTLGYKGRLLLDGHWHTASAHSAGQATPAAEQAVAYWQAVQAYCASFNADKPRLFDQLLPSLRAINTTSDGLHDEATLTIGLRLPPKLDPTHLIETLCGLLPDDAPATLAFRGGCFAYQGDKNNPLVRAMLKGIRAHGGTPGFLLKTGTSDMNVVGPVWQCPILAYGPGDSALDHTPDEHIPISEYLRAIEVLSTALHELC
ncbi:MAG: [LysW]-lysine hydrolase [Chloroflexaceae bacterium]|nr:[LysW]-lysine hydrolase [Chloroflexaceae bacterium]